MSICEECGGVDVHHAVTCSKSPAPVKAEPAPVVLPPPPDPFTLGQVVRYKWPSSGEMVTCLVTSMDGGEVGLMVLNPHVRVHKDDVEEI